MLRPRPGIEKIKPATHGGINYAELAKLGMQPEDILDFSVSTNPFGPPPGIREALCQAVIERYPDSESTALKTVLAKKLNVAPENLIIGSGATELIRLMATAYFGPGDAIIIPQPTYREYEIACYLTGAKVIKQPMPVEPVLRLDVTETVDLIRQHRPKGIFIGNPNNPTGQYLSREEITQILDAAPASLVVLDEAYIAFTDNAWESIKLINRSNLAILRSMTKDYALAGLRIGYAVAASPIISVLRRIKSPWNVSSVAQAAGIFALKADGYLDECRMKIKEAKEFLLEGLRGLGFSPLFSDANFFLVEVGGGEKFRQALLRRGVIVRDCTSFGLPDYIRLAPGTTTECQKLLAAIKETVRLPPCQPRP